MRLPNNAVMKALFVLLKQKSPVPVYDYLPQNAKFPYITIGHISVEDKSTKIEDIFHVTANIHVWSDYKGRYEVNSLAEKVIHILTSNQLAVDGEGFFSTSQAVNFYESYPEDEHGYNSIITFEMLIQDKGVE